MTEPDAGPTIAADARAAGISGVLAAVLAPGRAPEERAASLRALQDHLQDDGTLVALARAARSEKTASVRAAMLDVLIGAGPSGLARQDELLETVTAFSALEPEPALRLAATECLAALAPSSPPAVDVLAENLLHDLSPDVARACLAGIAACPRKDSSVVERLVAFARRAPAALVPQLLDVYEQLEGGGSEPALLALLGPLEDEALRRRALFLLGKLPSLSGAAAGQLVSYLAAEPLPELREQVVRLLSNGVRTTPGFLRAVLDDVLAAPGDAALPQAFRDRLLSSPEAVAQLSELFGSTGPTHAKLYVLGLLADTGAVTLFAAALEDPSPWARSEALRLCSRYAQSHSDEVGRALVNRFPREPLPALRAEMIAALGALGPLGPGAEQVVLDWLPREVAPDARRALAGVLPQVAVTDRNRAAVLRAYLEVLRDPLFGPELKALVGKRLSAFDHRDEPGLGECLMELMERATDLREVEGLYEQLRTLRVDVAPLVPLIRRLFYRFVGLYPQAPLGAWLRELVDAAAVRVDIRAEIPYLVRLTGASWVLEKAEIAGQKAAMLSAVLEAARRSPGQEAERLLADAYAHRALRESDAIRLFHELVSYYPSYPLLGSVLGIFRDARIVNGDLVERCLALLSQFPEAQVAYDVKEYLREMGPLEPAWSEQLGEAFCAGAYRRFRQVCTSPDFQYTRDDGWSEDWSAPRELRAWPVADLFLAQASPEAVAAKLGTPIAGGEGGPRSCFQYLVLAHVNQLSMRRTLDVVELLAVGRLLRAARSLPGAGVLYDRALYVFDRSWPAFARSCGGPSSGGLSPGGPSSGGLSPGGRSSGRPAGEPPWGSGVIEPELAEVAAEVFVELCERHHALGPGTTVRGPAPLTGMDLDHCEAVWSLGAAAWEALWERYATYLEKPRAMLLASPGRGSSSAGPSSNPAEPVAFRPLGADERTPLLEFLFRTPLGRGPSWPARWQRMLRAGRWSHDFSRLLAGLSEVEHKRVVDLMAL
jgi:uncharacterized membrane protein YgcG